MNSEEKNSLLAENEKLKELTDREWISKIVQMPRNANDVVILQELKKEWSELLIQTVEFAKYKIVQQVLNGKDSEGNQLVDINFQNEQGYTALSIAAKIGDDEKIALLLKNGANIELAKEEKISKKESKKLEEIYQQVKKATEDLVSAIVMGNNLRVKKLLNTTPVDVNMTVMIPIYGMGPSSPLMYAVNEGNIELVELLLKQPNINVNVRDNAGRTALIYAVSITYDTKKLLLDTPGVKEFLESLQQPIVKLLLKHPKIDVNALDHNKRTALQYAESFNDIKTIKLLLDHPDIDVNLQDNMGNTILMRMAFSGAKDIVELLLKVPNIEINKRNRVGTTALIIAASQGQRKIVQLLLNQPDIDINTQEEEGLSALCAAIRYGYKKVAELLLKHPKCDVNLQIVNGWNALMYASCKIDNKEILELLLNHPDINLNQINKSGFTALMIASNNNQSEIVKLLLSHPDIDLNIQGIYGRGYSVLIYEACIGHKEIVELLLKNPSININLQDNQGTTALIHAIINDHEEIVELLLKQPSIDINLQDKNGGTALIWAASGGHTKSVELLLQQPNIDINKRDLQGNIALSYTVTRNHKEILEQLLKQSNVDLKTLRAALITAICKGYIEIVELLLKQPDIDINDEYVEAIIIIFGMATGNENIIKLFIDKGLNVNKKFFGGEVTLLMLAIQFGFYRIINLLLKQPGIDINIKDANDETAFDYAQRNGRIKIIKLIQSKMGLNYYNQQFESLKKEIHFLKEKNINETFIEAVTQGDINKIDLLLDENEDENEETLVNFTDTIDVNTRNKNGDTALIIASDNDNLEAVKLLLEYQADVSLKDVNGDNALIRAARKGHFDVVEELLYQKTNINSTGQHKITALMAAAENGYLRVVKLLIKKGAKISIKNNYDKTALDIVNEKIINLNHNTNSNYYLIKNVLECQSKQLELPFNGEMPNLFNIWEVILDKNYEKDFKEWEKNDPIIYDKIKLLMKHIEYDPFRGLGRVERLTGNLEGLYSRRINKQNRLVYDIDGEKVLLQSCKGHYKREKRKNTRSRHNSKK